MYHMKHRIEQFAISFQIRRNARTIKKRYSASSALLFLSPTRPASGMCRGSPGIGGVRADRAADAPIRPCTGPFWTQPRRAEHFRAVSRAAPRVCTDVWHGAPEAARESVTGHVRHFGEPLLDSRTLRRRCPWPAPARTAQASSPARPGCVGTPCASLPWSKSRGCPSLSGSPPAFLGCPQIFCIAKPKFRPAMPAFRTRSSLRGHQAPCNPAQAGSVP